MIEGRTACVFGVLLCSGVIDSCVDCHVCVKEMMVVAALLGVSAA